MKCSFTGVYKMFRPLTRKNKEISRAECIEILKVEKRGILSVNTDGGYPYSMPMNHYYNEEDGCIYFHSGRKGHRLDSLGFSDKVCFCVCEEGYCQEGEWAKNVRSVIVFGKAEIIDEINAVEDIARKLSYKFTDDKEYIESEIKKFSRATLLIRLVPLHICGKRVKEE